LEARGFVNGFSTRLGGVSPFPAGDLNLAGFNEDTAENIHENRRRFLSAFEGNRELALAWQVHGSAIRTIRTREEIGDSDERADALVSHLDGVLIGVKTADCVPVLIGDPTKRAFAAVHGGGGGTDESMVKKAVKGMTEIYGTEAADLVCAIGPAACAANYEIGRDVMETFRANFVGSEKYFTSMREGHAFVDLHLANKDH